MNERIIKYGLRGVLGTLIFLGGVLVGSDYLRKVLRPADINLETAHFEATFTVVGDSTLVQRYGQGDAEDYLEMRLHDFWEDLVRSDPELENPVPHSDNIRLFGNLYLFPKLKILKNILPDTTKHATQRNSV